VKHDPLWLTASEIAAAYAAHELSPVELVQALLDQIGACNSQIGAFINVDADGALDAARRAEKDIVAGRYRGPLHGIPFGLKDNIDVAGQVTSCHSKILLNNVARDDAGVIGNLRAAGAFPLGKQALHEFAFGGPCDELPFPYARHPWNTAYHPGGSSSGSGAALAAGFVPLSVGTDAGGSIRNPAGNCGVVGLKPTYGLLSLHGVFPVSFTLDHVGPMARSVADVALMLDAMAGRHATGPGNGSYAIRSFADDLSRGVRGLRVGFVRHFHHDDMVAAPEVGAALEEVARVLEREGATVSDVRLPRLQEMAGVQRVILLAETWAVHAKWLRERPQDYTTPTRRKVMPGAFLSAGDYIHAQQCRAQMIDAVDDVFRDVDVLLTTSGMDAPFRIDDAAGLARTYPRQGRSPFNLTGHPALAMMSGLSKSGLPLSVQFVGRAFDEATLLRVAAAYERVTRWSTVRPPINGATNVNKHRSQALPQGNPAIA
jgi:aspartyl-tRNA(Asn)/glutamyl-tRNA(Gln) amidotransferase subunit A